MKRTRRGTKKEQVTTKRIIVALITAIGVIRSVVSILSYFDPSTAIPPKSKASITINYMRLFGAIQVPWVMASTYYYKLGIHQGERIDKSLPADAPLAKFFSTWKYKSAEPIKTALWDEQCGGGFINSLMCIGMEGDRKGLDYLARLQFNTSFVGDETQDEFADRLKRTLPDVAKRTGSRLLTQNQLRKLCDYVESKSQNIGFLFLILENKSPVPISEVKISYKEFINSKTTRWTSSPGCYGCECIKPDIATYPQHQYVDGYFKNISNNKTKTIYSLSSGESVIMLLSVYLKDGSGYPDRYLSNVIKPVSISFSDPSSQIISQNVREPLRDKAAQIAVPFGWFGQ